MIDKHVLVRDRIFFDAAQDIARYGEHRVRVGCVAAVNGKRIAGAFNSYRNNPAITSYGNATYHAEWNTVSQIPDRFREKATLYICRINQAGELVPSAPCDRCRVELSRRGVREFVYIDKRGDLVKVRT